MTVQARPVRANGVDIHYVEAGQGEPLVLLDNAMVSSNPVWTGHVVTELPDRRMI
jgi:hypothetical protein